MEEAHEVGDNVGMLVLEAKSLRPFRTKDEYLYAMKEDLAEWFTCLYQKILINAENFMEVLETGVLLCQHANEVRKFAEEQKLKGTFEIKSNFVRDIQIPQYDVQFRVDVKPGTFLARDNISNFITWTAKMGIPEVLRFETDDLVMRKNERSVVLCLLELARVGAKFGMLAPTIVQMEEEIDNEIETGEPPPQIITCDIKSLDEMVRELVGYCTCPIQFPIIKVGEGKYKIGDNQTLVFVRILRKHVMIRVGGGWDTLEHYLDRHDPCRCGFTGHRGGGRGPSTPRRGSTTAVSKSVPSTPKTNRKLSLTAPVSSTHSVGTPRPTSPGIGGASPGPNTRKTNLTIKGNNSQPSSTVTSPSAVSKKPNFSNPGKTDSEKIQQSAQNGLNNSGNFPVGNYVKQSQANITRQLSSNSSGSQPPVTPRRSASPAPRPESPAQRRSESPAPVIAARLRSPSPAPSAQNKSNVARPQSVPATQRCPSPVRQITLSELRSSREGKLTNQNQPPTTPRTIRRQTSSDSNRSRTSESEMMGEPGSSSFAIDRISTMSLGEFKNLLNSALAVPNGNADSQCSSDSPRSQGSMDGGTVTPKTNKSMPAKSAYSYRSVSASRNQTYKSNLTNSKTGINPKAIETQGSRNTTGHVSSENTVRSLHTSTAVSNINSPANLRTSTNTGCVTGVSSKPTSARANVRGAVQSSGYGQDRPKTPSSMSRSSSKTSSVGDSSHTVQPMPRSIFASRSSSHSSINSCESTDDGQYSMGPDTADQGNTALTPSSVDSDYSFRGSSGTSSDYARSNSYTPCSAAEERLGIEKLHASLRAKSEPKEDISSISRDIQKAYGVHEEKPKNVGYATFSYENGNDTKDSNELNEIENEIVNARQPDLKSDNNVKKSDTDTSRQIPSGRQTPSFIPRPITPKMSRKLSLPQHDDMDNLSGENDRVKSSARPPTPKKSTVIARAHGAASAGGVRAADKNREQTYRELFQKRSTTPGPGSSSSTGVTNYGRRSMTPGPDIQKTTTLRPTSATTNRTRLNEAIEQAKGPNLSVYNTPDDDENMIDFNKTQIIDKKKLTKQKSLDQEEAVIMVKVNRSEGRHSISVPGEKEPRQSLNKPKVLARARNEENRARSQVRAAPAPAATRQRPQSVEPRQLIPRGNSESSSETLLSVKRDENGQHVVYDRTQEWVQTAVEQTKVKKTKTKSAYAHNMRRSMTPNSFNMRIDPDNEEPRTLEEIKAALSLPIENIPSVIASDLEAPPEDPEMYATMEKLFHELRQQELKNSVNETPGNNENNSKARKTKSKSSKSNSSNNDEQISLDSNRNVKTKTNSTSTKSSSNVTSPSMQRSSRGTANQTPRNPAASRTSSSSSTIASNSASATVRPVTNSGSSITQRASQPRSPSPKSTAQRPPSPHTTAQLPPRPQSPRVSSVRLASPRVDNQPPRPASPRVSPQISRPASPSPRVTSTSISRGSTPTRTQPPRPASTPPIPSTLVAIQSSKSSDENDSVFDTNKKSDSGNLISKIKELIKVKPRKDKAEAVKGKSRIPAPKSLANVGKSRSFTNLSNLRTLSLSSEESNGYSLDDHEINGYGEHINGGLNVTLSGRSETPKLKLNTPLTTGRSSLIRKESMEKNKNTHRLTKALSVERNMHGLNNNYQYSDDGEYV